MTIHHGDCLDIMPTLAAEQEGFAWIGIEREEEYVRIAEARLNGTQKGMGLGA